jgi:hypothetical protein
MAPWTLERLQTRASHTDYGKMDFGSVTALHLDKGCQSKVPVTCKHCSYKWSPTISSVFKTRGTGCPKCRRSKMEEHASRVLEDIKGMSSLDPCHWKLHRVDPQFRLHGTEHRPGYQGCNTMAQSADFLLTIKTSDGVAHLFILELDGRQHFETVRFGGTSLSTEELETRLRKQQHDDHQKDLHCQRKNWRILRISHSVSFTEYDAHIRHMVTTCLRSTQKNIVRMCVGKEYEREHMTC